MIILFSYHDVPFMIKTRILSQDLNALGRFFHVTNGGCWPSTPGVQYWGGVYQDSHVPWARQAVSGDRAAG